MIKNDFYPQKKRTALPQRGVSSSARIQAWCWTDVTQLPQAVPAASSCFIFSQPLQLFVQPVPFLVAYNNY